MKLGPSTQPQPLADHGAFLSFPEFQPLAAVSRSWCTLVKLLQGAGDGANPPCVDCKALLSTGARQPIALVRVGPGTVSQAGSRDYGKYRYCVTTTAAQDALLHVGLRRPTGERFRDGRPPVMPRVVQSGVDCTVHMRGVACTCGWIRCELRAARALPAGSELVALEQGTWEASQCHLVIAGDGGGKWVQDRPCFGAGLVAFVYARGVSHRLADLALPLYAAESAQEAEAAVGWEAVMWRTEALRIARSRGFDPTPPDVLYGDSANTAGALDNRMRLRAAAPNRWAARMREVTAAHTREWLVLAVPRSMNKAADQVATTAWKLVRDVQATRPKLQVTGPNADQGLALSEAYRWLQVLVVFSRVRANADIEQLGWRAWVAERLGPSYSQLPGSINKALPPLGWSALRLQWSHEALFYALVLLPAQSTRTGQRLYRA